MPDAGVSDFLIVGGGSAGCVLAARLSENPNLRVTLIEAGRDVSADMPAEIRSGYPGRPHMMAANLWPGLTANLPQRPDGEAPVYQRYEQPRILGGGSSINGLGANRGAHGDYDEWSALGITGWGFADLLPWFRKLERDVDHDGDPLHGNRGPIPVRRLGPRIWTPFVHAMLANLMRRGVRFLPDQNGPWADGVFEMAVAVDDDGNRVSTADGYLTPQVRARPNLQIRTGTTVESVIMEAGRATGVVIRHADQRTIMHASNVVLSAGTLASPALLMRSGVGPAAHLTEAGIGVVRDLPGVGRNLMEHPCMAIVADTLPHARQHGPAYYHIPIGYRFSSGVEGCPQGDMHLNVMTRSGWHEMGRQLSPLIFWVNKSYSRGILRLDPARPDGPPVIDFAMLSDERDLVRLAGAFEHAIDLLADPAMQGTVRGAYPAVMSPLVRRLSAPGLFNDIAMRIAGAALDLSGGVRARLLPHVLAKAPGLAELRNDRAALTAFIRSNIRGVWHPAGTCRMGVANDPMAVVDANGAVLGVEGLWVCDASILPTMPCANINIPTLMAAEKIAAGLASR